MRTLVLWLIVGDLALSGLVIFWRGASGNVRTYNAVDAVVGLAEAGLAAWGVYWLAMT